jgi:hypothetical protein
MVKKIQVLVFENTQKGQSLLTILYALHPHVATLLCLNNCFPLYKKSRVLIIIKLSMNIRNTSGYIKFANVIIIDVFITYL